MSLPAEKASSIVTSDGLDDLFTASQLILTVPEASKQLGIPQSTLYRHIKAGKYKTVRTKDDVVRIIIDGESQVTDSEDCEEANNTTETAILIESQSDSELRELRSKLEAATYRVGYLEAKLEEREVQIRLLTDSQREKRSIWSRLQDFFRD